MSFSNCRVIGIPRTALSFILLVTLIFFVACNDKDPDGTSGTNTPNSIDNSPANTDTTDNTSGTDTTDNTSGTDTTDNTSGTDTADNTSGTDTADNTSGTDTADNTSGTDTADNTSGTDTADNTSGTDTADNTSGTDTADNASGTDTTDNTSGTDTADNSKSPDTNDDAGDSESSEDDSYVGGDTNAVCTPGTSPGAVQQPVFVRNVDGQTSWYASPVIANLDGVGTPEIVAAYYTLYVLDAKGNVLDSAPGNGGRIYAPHVVADLDNDGIIEIACGQRHEVYVYEWRNNGLQLKNGWPVNTTSAGESPEVRGMAAGDLNGDGRIEIVVTTTQTQPTSSGGAQVFVYDAGGSLYQPEGLSYQAWPRYNTLTGEGGDADRNGMGHNGFGCYGLNVGIGNIDDDKELEIITTYDNHHIQAFNHDGRAIDASNYYTNRNSDYTNQPLTWGQFIRWADADVETAHYHLHEGEWPHPSRQEWLQWTASPPNVVDLNGDGRNEVVGVPNIEMIEETDGPYVTQAYGIMVLEGAYGDGQRSARRLSGWEILPRGGKPIHVDGWYPPKGVPAPTTCNIHGDNLPEIIASLNDGYLYAFAADGGEIWRYNYTHGQTIMFCSEAMVADLNQDGSPEIIFSTYGDPNQQDAGNLIILAADGNMLFDIALPNPGHNGNGNGAPAAPTVADLDNDGQLEILVQTFDHGMDIFTVPGSGNTCRLWTTARGGPLRNGRYSQ